MLHFLSLKRPNFKLFSGSCCWVLIALAIEATTSPMALSSFSFPGHLVREITTGGTHVELLSSILWSRSAEPISEAHPGMAVGRDLKGRKNHVVAVIGDGAMTAGQVYEAMNKMKACISAQSEQWKQRREREEKTEVIRHLPSPPIAKSHPLFDPIAGMRPRLPQPICRWFLEGKSSYRCEE